VTKQISLWNDWRPRVKPAVRVLQGIAQNHIISFLALKKLTQIGSLDFSAAPTPQIEAVNFNFIVTSLFIQKYCIVYGKHFANEGLD
jgi:hypothetical protein